MNPFGAKVASPFSTAGRPGGLFGTAGQTSSNLQLTSSSTLNSSNPNNDIEVFRVDITTFSYFDFRFLKLLKTLFKR